MPGFSGAPLHAFQIRELTQLIQKYSIDSLDAAGYQKVNFGATAGPGGTPVINATLDALAAQYNGNVPQGMLGGAVVVTKGSGVVGPPTVAAAPTATELAKGLLVRQTAGMPFEGTQTDEANKPTYYSGPGARVAVGVYETRRRDSGSVFEHSVAAADDFILGAGKYLFVDLISGLLTIEPPRNAGGEMPAYLGTYAITGAVPTNPDAGFDPDAIINFVGLTPIARIDEVEFEGTLDLAITLLV